MNKNFTELLAAWVVAVALIGAIAAHTFLPKTPPHLAGVAPANATRVGPIQRDGSSGSDQGLPLIEFGYPDRQIDEPDQDVATPALPAPRGSALPDTGRRPFRS